MIQLSTSFQRKFDSIPHTVALLYMYIERRVEFCLWVLLQRACRKLKNRNDIHTTCLLVEVDYRRV